MRTTHELIPLGDCACGCGLKTTIAPQTDTAKGYIKGTPRKFIVGHKGRPGDSHWNWKGGRNIDKKGYVLIHSPDNPIANFRRYVREHILIAEKTLGKLLPPGAVVHHVNGSKDSGPLVICESEGYHSLLHQRMRALKACGHANWRKCPFCKQYDDTDRMVKCGHAFCHSSCRVRYHQNRRDEKGGRDAAQS